MRRTSKRIQRPVKFLHEIGHVIKYYANLGVAVVKLSKSVRLGDKIVIRSSNSNLTQKVDFMEVNTRPVKLGKSGMEVSMRIDGVVNPDDIVMRLKF